MSRIYKSLPPKGTAVGIAEFDAGRFSRVLAPGHCTGEPAFAALKRGFGGHFVYAGLGTTVAP